MEIIVQSGCKNEEKDLLIDSMLKLLEHIYQNKQHQAEIFNSFSIEDLEKLILNIEDKNQKLRKISARFICELLHDNYKTQLQFCDLLGVAPVNGKVCINNIPEKIIPLLKINPNLLDHLTQASDEEVISTSPLCWFYTFENALDKQKQVNYYHKQEVGQDLFKLADDFIDPSSCLFGFIMQSQKQFQQNIKKTPQQVNNLQNYARLKTIQDTSSINPDNFLNQKRLATINDKVDEQLKVQQPDSFARSLLASSQNSYQSPLRSVSPQIQQHQNQQYQYYQQSNQHQLLQSSLNCQTYKNQTKKQQQQPNNYKLQQSQQNQFSYKMAESQHSNNMNTNINNNSNDSSQDNIQLRKSVQAREKPDYMNSIFNNNNNNVGDMLNSVLNNNNAFQNTIQNVIERKKQNAAIQQTKPQAQMMLEAQNNSNGNYTNFQITSKQQQSTNPQRANSPTVIQSNKYFLSPEVKVKNLQSSYNFTSSNQQSNSTEDPQLYKQFRQIYEQANLDSQRKQLDHDKRMQNQQNQQNIYNHYNNNYTNTNSNINNNLNSSLIRDNSLIHEQNYQQQKNYEQQNQQILQQHQYNTRIQAQQQIQMQQQQQQQSNNEPLTLSELNDNQQFKRQQNGINAKPGSIIYTTQKKLSTPFLSNKLTTLITPRNIKDNIENQNYDIQNPRKSHDVWMNYAAQQKRKNSQETSKVISKNELRQSENGGNIASIIHMNAAQQNWQSQKQNNLNGLTTNINEKKKKIDLYQKEDYNNNNNKSQVSTNNKLKLNLVSK